MLGKKIGVQVGSFDMVPRIGLDISDDNLRVILTKTLFKDREDVRRLQIVLNELFRLRFEL